MDKSVLLRKRSCLFNLVFVDHDPPKTLTEGDEIALPVVVRSYLEKDQSVKLAVKPESWFAASDASVKSVNVKAGDTVREIFGFKAISPVTAGKHRITATGSNASDAIEKSVS